MQTNGRCLYRLILFFGFLQYVKLMSADGEDEINTPTANTVTEHSSDPHFTTRTSHSKFTDDGNKHIDLEESSPTEIPPSDITTILMCAAPAIILVLLIPLTIVMVRHKRRKKHKEVSSEPPNEDTKSPIFEEDTPSVMEIEMEDLDKWMSNMKNNSCRLSTLEEENKLCTSLES